MEDVKASPSFEGDLASKYPLKYQRGISSVFWIMNDKVLQHQPWDQQLKIRLDEEISSSEIPNSATESYNQRSAGFY